MHSISATLLQPCAECWGDARCVQELACIAWGVAQLQAVPNTAWFDELGACSEEMFFEGRLEGRQLAMLLPAMGRLGQAVHEATSGEWLASAAEQVRAEGVGGVGGCQQLTGCRREGQLNCS